MTPTQELLLAVQLAERRIELIGMYGQAAYERRTAYYKPLIEREQASRRQCSPFRAASAICKRLDRTYRDTCNETSKQYALCAALELFEQ